MKGLFLAFGLIAALFISNSYASIYDTSISYPPKNERFIQYKCYLNGYVYPDNIVSTNTVSDASICVPSATVQLKKQNKCIAYDITFSSPNTLKYKLPKLYTTPQGATECHASIFTENQASIGADKIKDEQTTACPPELYPDYIFQLDLNNDAKPDKCYNPRELDNASKCSDLFNSGSILSAGNNTSSLVCKTFEDGSRCAFSRVEQGSTPYYQPNLEKGCFGDAEEIPDYDKDAPPAPQPEQCVPYFGGFACAADPKNYCSSSGSCIDGCGYVNDQFMCFRDEQCKGASCEPAPVNCETVPDAPICKDKDTTPKPSFCEKNPTVESCQGGSNFCKKNPLAPSCQLGGDGGGTGGGGSDFVLDYDKLINGMKGAVKLIIDPNETPEFSEFKSEIDDKTSELDSEIDNFMNGSHFDGINDQISSNPFTGQFQLPSGGGCTAFDLGGHSLDLCGAAQKISSVLYYVFSFLTLLYLKNLFFSTVTPRKE